MGTLQNKIKSCLKNNGVTTINNIRSLTGMDASSISNALRALRKWGEVERSLKGKNILWRVKNDSLPKRN